MSYMYATGFNIIDLFIKQNADMLAGIYNKNSQSTGSTGFFNSAMQQNADMLAGIYNKYNQPTGNIGFLNSAMQQNANMLASINNNTPKWTIDANGNRKESITNPDGIRVKDTYYKAFGGKTQESLYDSKGNLERDNYFGADGKINKYTTYNADGAVKNKVTRTYDSSGAMTDTQYDANGKHTQTSFYDVKGNLEQSNSYGTDGKINKYTTYNADGTVKNTLNASLTKEDLSLYLKNAGLSDSVDANLKDYELDNLIQDFGGKDGKVDSDTLQSYLDVNKNGKLNKTEIDSFFNNLQTTAGNLNNAKSWKADNGYGYVDWNNDGKFRNDGTVGNKVSDGHECFVAVHGDLDKFCTDFGSNYQAKNLKGLVDSKDNTVKDKDSRTGFVSNGTVSAHKVSDSQYGFSVTARDKSASAGVDYNYAVYDINRDAYILGNDKNNDGLVKNDEILGIINKVGGNAKMASPLVFDLNGNGTVDTTGIEKDYDINGDGNVDKTAWAGLGDGILAFDADKDGQAGLNGKELFGNNTDVAGNGEAGNYENGFEALTAVAEKYLGINAVSDGKLDANEISALEEKSGFTMLVNELVNGKVVQVKKSLVDLGITEISLGYRKSDLVDENGNQHKEVGEGFVINSQQAKVDDVWFSYV